MGDNEEPIFEDDDFLVTRSQTRVRNDVVANTDIERVESVVQERRYAGTKPVFFSGLFFLAFAIYLAAVNFQNTTTKAWIQTIAVSWIGLSLAWKGFPKGKDLQLLKLRMKNGNDILYRGAPAQVEQAKTMIELARSLHAPGSKD